MRTLFALALIPFLVACGDEPLEEGDDANECRDRADNDADGLFDCDDPGCAGSPDCVGGPTPPGPGTGGPGPGTGTGTGTGTTTDTGTFTGPCLDIQTVYLGALVAWDGVAQEGRTFLSAAGTQEPGYFYLLFGPAGWDGDDSGPGAPDNHCYATFFLDGQLDTNSDPAYRAEWVMPAEGETTCGRESSPGAGNAVAVCNNFFPTGDPHADLAAEGLTVRISPTTHASQFAYRDSLMANYGYETNEFWGAEVWWNRLPGGHVPALSFGLQVTPDFQAAADPNGGPLRHNTTTAFSGGALTSGAYYIASEGLDL